MQFQPEKYYTTTLVWDLNQQEKQNIAKATDAIESLNITLCKYLVTKILKNKQIYLQ